MVHLPTPGKFRLDSDQPRSTAAAAKVEIQAVKVEIEDSSEEEHGPLSKKPKNATLPQQQGMPCNVLEEPSPLGLRLRKSPSLLDLIQMRLSQVNSGTMSCISASENAGCGKRRDLKSAAVSTTADKLKASNFPLTLLRIGIWERVSKYEGDLVAKCYFAKHKLVWEVLEGGLKSKIEIQWSDISSLKATCPENDNGTLEIVLARPPLFYKETDPQPRKHTLWQATTDFTGGEASKHRRHFLECPQGLLSKNIEKLIKCDSHLNLLSRQPDIILESPYFEPRLSVFDDQVEAKSHDFDNMNDGNGLTSGLCDSGTPCATSSTSLKSAGQDSVDMAPDPVSQETPSPSTGTESRPLEEHTSSERVEKERMRRDPLKASGPEQCTSTSDLVNRLENCTSKQMASGNALSSSDTVPTKEILETISQQLLDDSQGASVLDERSLLPRVNSFLSLITPQSPQVDNGDGMTVDDEPDSVPPTDAVDGGAQPPISRNESYGELLMHLPRIASLPRFFSNTF